MYKKAVLICGMLLSLSLLIGCRGQATQPIPSASPEPSQTPYTVTATTAPPTVTEVPPTPSVAPTEVALEGPIRAAFYYPWFPESWDQGNMYPYTNYKPKLGYYSSDDEVIIKQHIAMMQYGNIQAGLASWWGRGTHTDTKIAELLSDADGTGFKWGLYYENESQGDPTASQIQKDLTYIHDTYAQSPNFLKVDGKFVVFVYAAGNDGCGMADRWKQANTVNAYVVLKVFPGYGACLSQPDSWHQYGPAVAEDRQGATSFSISPGFWLAGDSNKRLERNIDRWYRNVRNMVNSGAQWQLITTFNEWGEGTAVEPAEEWPSDSGYGPYLDALHNNGEQAAH